MLLVCSLRDKTSEEWSSHCVLRRKTVGLGSRLKAVRVQQESVCSGQTVDWEKGLSVAHFHLGIPGQGMHVTLDCRETGARGAKRTLVAKDSSIRRQ